MSLINQALRKAQQDRTPKRMEAPGASGSLTSAPAGASGMRPGLLIGLIIALAVLVGLVAGLSIVLLQNDDSGAIAEQAPTTPEQPTIQSTNPTPPPEAVASSPPALEPIRPAIESSSNSASPERETISPVVEELRMAREAAEAKAAAELAAAEAKAAQEAKAAEEAATQAAAKPSQEIIDWLSRARVTGVRLSETESKVILNGASYSVGEYVNFALRLKVMIIQEKRILFADDHGQKYMKRL